MRERKGRSQESGVRSQNARRGQSTVEFIISYGVIVLPLTLAVIFTSQLLWIWHGVNEFTRAGASYASTHCWVSSASQAVVAIRNEECAYCSGDLAHSCMRR